MSDPDRNAVAPASPSVVALWGMRGIALAAASATIYLLTVSLMKSGRPLGCGSGSGCAEVLVSRWSVVFGIPVSAPAALLYVSALAATFFISPGRSEKTRRIAWTALAGASGVIVAAAAWFIAIQALVLKAFCPWCMADHALGLSFAALVFWNLPVGKTDPTEAGDADPTEAGKTDPTKAGDADSRVPDRPLFRPFDVARSAALGAVLFAAVPLAQTFMSYQSPKAARLPPGKNADTGPGSQRWISVLGGKLQLAVHEEPLHGSPDAKHLLVLCFDYCCPHCRATHGYLKSGLKNHKRELAVVALPTPLNEACNPHWSYTSDRFKDSCELARLALAVWIADPDAFPGFDDWLYEPETPRSAADARREAERLVTAAALDKALADPSVDDRLLRNAGAFEQVQKMFPDHGGSLPVILAVNIGSFVGRPESEAALFAKLKEELHRAGMKHPEYALMYKQWQDNTVVGNYEDELVVMSIAG
ncbi:MAG: vitamin K epoxide reductase family protein, partial [Planctomycetales bacterium]